MRISVLMAVSMVALAAPVSAKEIRQVAPGITMAPGLPNPAKPKQAEAPKVETSKSQKTTYGEPVAPSLPDPTLEAKVEPPKPGQPAVAVNAKSEPDRNAVSRPVAASPAAIPSQPVSQQKVVTAPDQPRAPRPQSKQAASEPRIGDRIPDDARLYPAQRVRVGDRVPDNVQLYDLPRSALR
jgi:hypothetical protein